MNIDVSKLTAMLTDYALPFIGICAWLALGLWASSFLARLLQRGCSPRFGADRARTLARAVKYLLMALFVATLVSGLGVDIRAVLGAAGVAGIAVGFASQTSLSNLISGLFLVLERPFKVGDWIELDGVSGYVHSIEVLSTYVRTFDNRLVRIPNETLAKAKVVNLSAYPIRRLDLEVAVSCREDASRVMRLLREALSANPSCFREPEPLVLLKSFGPSSMEFLIAVWVERDELQQVRSAVLNEIKARFDREGVALPFQRWERVGDVTEPRARREGDGAKV